MALTAARNTPRRENLLANYPVAAAGAIYAGGMVTLLTSGGWAVAAGTASAGLAVGVAIETVTGDGTNGLNRVTVERGCFRFLNSSAGDAITHVDIGNACYIVDDQTVAKTDDSASRAIAGLISDVDADGVWVVIAPGAVGPQGPQGEPGV
ncbi:MAG: hypothetical protein ACT4PG_09310 [Panacagrimonas sp.]